MTANEPDMAILFVSHANVSFTSLKFGQVKVNQNTITLMTSVVIANLTVVFGENGFLNGLLLTQGYGNRMHDVFIRVFS